MKKIKLYLVIALSFAGFVSCNDWLTLHPDNAQTTDQYWQSKQDVESVIAAGYVRFRECVKDHSLFVWGEMRGEMISITNATLNDDIKAAQKIRNLDIETTNTFVSWAKLYRVIGLANSVLKYAPAVRELDPSFSLAEMNSYFSEAYFLRALSYFYLVRTFKDVPLILEPYVEDSEQFEIPKSPEEDVLAQIIADLKRALELPPREFYTETDETNPVNTKGRATKWSIYALLADVYLWRGDEALNDYESVISACQQVRNYEVENGGKLTLLGTSEWFDNYYPGNSAESIFEVQFDYNKQQSNSFVNWFAALIGASRTANNQQVYGISESAVLLFYTSLPLGDNRGLGGSYDPYGGVWKYSGFSYYYVDNAVRSNSNQSDQNFIIYRLADIYLIQAEAYIMQGNYSAAIELIADIRRRAGIQEVLSTYSTELEMLDLLLNEKAREFIGEGKRWFDLLRVARRHNYQYKEYMIEHSLEALSPGNVPMARQKLADPYAHYLPIHKDELMANKLLDQNPYYENLGN